MKTRLKKYLEVLRESYWFYPLVMAMGAFVLAWFMIQLDRGWQVKPPIKFFWIYAGGPEGARAVLSLIASSMITVAGVVFSITIVALTLASQQFGPRLLRNFMKDRGNQMVLGIFIGTFIYCIIVLPTVQGVEAAAFVPYFSVTMGVLLALLSVFVLIYFIHHIPALMQVSTVINGVTQELLLTIKEFWPKKITADSSENGSLSKADEQLSDKIQTKGKNITSRCSGYLQAIDYDGLLKLAVEHNFRMVMLFRPGHFVIKNSVVGKILSAGDSEEGINEAINNAFFFGIKRTITQDIEYAISEMVEVALRALSPGINDPRTAINCIDRLGEGLSEMATRIIKFPYFYDEDKNLRVIGQPQTFRGTIDQSFNEIRQIGRGNTAICVRLLEVLEDILHHTKRHEDRAALLIHGEMIIRSCRESIQEKCDLEVAETRYRDFLTTLDSFKESKDLHEQ